MKFGSKKNTFRGLGDTFDGARVVFHGCAQDDQTVFRFVPHEHFLQVFAIRGNKHEILILLSIILVVYVYIPRNRLLVPKELHLNVRIRGPAVDYRLLKLPGVCHGKPLWEMNIEVMKRM